MQNLSMALKKKGTKIASDKGGKQKSKLTGQGHQRTFGSERNISHPNRSMGHMGVCIYQNSQNDTLKICAFHSIPFTSKNVKVFNSFTIYMPKCLVRKCKKCATYSEMHPKNKMD